MMKPLFRCLLALAASLPATAAVVLYPSDASLLPDLAGQNVSFGIRNEGAAAVQIAGVTFNIQVADGGLEPGGHVSGPKITGVDLISDGLLFAANHETPLILEEFPQFVSMGVITKTGTITLPAGASATLAQVTFDTTGFGQASWPLRLNDTINGATALYDSLGNSIAMHVMDGTLTLVPEIAAPVTTGLALLLAAGFMRGRATSRQG